jgi:hypothetical protein
MGTENAQGEITMKRLIIFAIVLAVPISLRADEKDAKLVAQGVLDQGSALFDSRDAAAMAATYTDDAQQLWIGKDRSTGEITLTIKKNRSEIESLYRDLFKDAKEKTTSKNTVEFARFLSPEVMVIYGVFQLNIAKPDKFPFVQTRVKVGDKWLMKTLQLYVVGG